MIDRYTLPKMGAIWNEQAKFQSWLDVELAVCDVWGQLGRIPEASLKNIKENNVDSKSRRQHESTKDQ